MPTEPVFERRTRIVCHFPLNRKPNQRKPNQIHVIRGFMKHLKQSELTGFTMSSLMDSVHTGFWRESPSSEFDEENIVVFVIDHPLEKNDPALWSFIADMKRTIQKLYKRYSGESEKDVWIVVHTIDRLV